MSLNFNPKGPIRIDKNALAGIKLADTTIIVDTARAYVEADVSVQPGSNTYTVVQQEGAFARVNVTVPEGGGYWVLLKKVNDIWVALLTGQDKPGQDIGKKYGLPSDWYLQL